MSDVEENRPSEYESDQAAMEADRGHDPKEKKKFNWGCFFIILAFFVLGIILSGVLVATLFNNFTQFGRVTKGSGHVIEEERNLPPFNAIQAGGACDLEIECSQNQKFEISSDDNILPLVKTVVQNGTLIIGASKNYQTTGDIRIKINTGDLERISVSGSSDVTIRGIKNKDFTIEISGSGDARAEGETDRLNLKVSGAAQIDAEELKARDVKANLTGASTIKVWASNELDVNISGAGTVEYSGKPKTIKKDISGAGSIRER